MSNIISKEQMRKLLSALSEKMTLIGPVDTGKVVEYREADASDILMDDQISYKSPKEYYFPQVEKLMVFSDEGVSPCTEILPTVIFGAKPCDLEALRVMQKVFMEGRYMDPFFAQHMEQNVIIGVACLSKKPGCFCDELGLDMDFSDFCDIFLSDLGDEYKVEFLSEKGKNTLDSFYKISDIIPEDNSKKASSKSDTINFPYELQDIELFDAVDWNKLTETCQSCGMCTFICPTCHCFEFKDVEKDGEASRYRLWDSCIYPKFTLHASGHNPRAAKAERYRQRVLHKYKYVKNNTGYTACTGCGRCIRSCPVGMNIKNVAKTVTEAKL